ncbi:MAG: hypothetical protein ABIJ14_04055 [Nanoarchaeota archaeon]
MQRKAQAQVISTILLILLAVTVAGIIMAFVIPFVRNQLSSSDCFDVADKLEITNNQQYTCYNNTDSNPTNRRMLVQVHLKDTDQIKGFTIELGGASTTTHNIKDGPAPTGVTMYDGSSILNIPSQNQERTYKIESTTKPQLIRIYPIIEGDKTCGESSSITTVNDCFII